MTQRELGDLIAESYRRAREIGDTVHKEVLDNRYSFQDPVCERHRIIENSASSYISALDRFSRDLRASTNLEAPCNSMIVTIVTRELQNLERLFSSRPHLYPKARRIQNQW